MDMAGPPVVAFLSTGRCGTQWLTTALRELYPGLDAEHEPLGPLYAPRRYFRRYEDPAAILEVSEVARHLERIASSTRTYVETGWPLFPVLPLLALAFRERLRVVHLTRHPVPSSLSHLAHQSYAGSPRDDAYTKLATLGPEDPGVFQAHYAESWEQLSPYEKCLFWWTEVHLFGLELPGQVDHVPVLRIKSEDLLSGRRAPLERLADFMGLSWEPGWLALTARHVDRWHHHTAAAVDPLRIHRHPGAVEVAAKLGYDLSSLNLGELEARYRGEPDPGLDRIGRFV
jgi:hypothetical protein